MLCEGTHCSYTSFHTNSDCHHGSTAAPIAVGCHNTDSVHYIVMQSDWNTCCISGQELEAWTNSYGVVNWSPTIVLWGLPPHCKGHVLPIKLLDNGKRSPWRKRETCIEIISKNIPWLSTADSHLWLQQLP